MEDEIVDRLRYHVAAAYTDGRPLRRDEHLRAALELLEDETAAGNPLAQCDRCGKLGLPERVRHPDKHNCV